MKLKLLIPAILVVAACGCGGKVTPDPIDAGSVSTNPTSLTIGPEGGELTVAVTASDAWQAYVGGEEIDWVRVDPAYCAEKTGNLTVKVDKIISNKNRTCEVVVKCGSTRHKIPLTQTGSTDIDIPEGYTLVWNDEFDKGDKPSSEWWYETGDGGWGNGELQTYVSQNQGGTDLAYLSDGTLKIKAQKIGGKVYSIRMNTKKAWTYGWFEARIKLTDVPGSWPAFWMMPQNFKAWPDNGEVDIMEYAISTQGKDRSSSSIHCKAYNHTAGTGKTHVQPVANAAGEFHVYACEWTKDGFKFYIDGKQHHSFANDGKNDYKTWPFSNPFYLKLNLAWGGSMGGTTNEEMLPAIFEIDYVRVFQK